MRCKNELFTGLKSSKILFISLFIFLTNCSISKKESNDDQLLFLISLFYSENHALFKYIPADITNLSQTANESQFPVASIFNKTSKPKIIFIHGWNLAERSTQNPTTNLQKINNINLTWKQSLKFINQNVLDLNNNYDFYFFTYRTSDSILTNGKRLILNLKQNFSQSDKVIIIAHSMGGLVSRSAVYDSENADLIDSVVTLGTPFYGSPFASSEYYGNLAPVLGDLIGFVTSTDGGKNLAYTNIGSNQSPLIGSSTNTTLDLLNSYTNKDSLFYPYYGELSSNCSGSGITNWEAVYGVSCNLLISQSPKFLFSDGIVPSNSGAMNSNSPRPSVKKAGYNHSMMSFQTPDSNQDGNLEFFKEVMNLVINL